MICRGPWHGLQRALRRRHGFKKQIRVEKCIFMLMDSGACVCVCARVCLLAVNVMSVMDSGGAMFELEDVCVCVCSH